MWQKKLKAAPEWMPPSVFVRLGDCYASLAMSDAKRTAAPRGCRLFPLPLERERVRVRE
jgi:hypothetical protein